jgi:hypothetical protein
MQGETDAAQQRDEEKAETERGQTSAHEAPLGGLGIHRPVGIDRSQDGSMVGRAIEKKAEVGQGLQLDLANAFPRQAELITDGVERESLMESPPEDHSIPLAEWADQSCEVGLVIEETCLERGMGSIAQAIGIEAEDRPWSCPPLHGLALEHRIDGHANVFAGERSELASPGQVEIPRGSNRRVDGCVGGILEVPGAKPGQPSGHPVGQPDVLGDENLLGRCQRHDLASV